MKPVRILVADDEDRVRQMIDFRLRLFGCEVLHAATGREALAVATAEQPDLILLDLMMPELDGYQVCARLRERERTRHIPIVILTAKAGADDVAHAFNAGAQDYVVKPYDPLTLQQKVAHNLEEPVTS